MVTVKKPVFSQVVTQLGYPLQADVTQILPGLTTAFSIRPLDLAKDLPVIYKWVNQPYAIPFWQMNGTYQNLLEAYQDIESSPIALSLVACLNGQIVSQLDMYDPFADPIHHYYDAREGDMGIHLLMAPGKKPVKDFTTRVLYLYLSVLFRNPFIEKIIGEPDVLNESANRLLCKLGFQFIRSLALPNKNANFYTMTRQQFFALSTDAFA